MLPEREIKALVTLLEDSDREVTFQIGEKIYSLGTVVIPYLKNFAFSHPLSANVQSHVQEIIDNLQKKLFHERIASWLKDSKRELLEGLWIIATYLYPDCQKKEITHSLRDIYMVLSKKFREDMTAYDHVRLINDVLFYEFGFEPNVHEINAPDNSMINRVLKTRQGNSTLLCLVYLMLARKLRIPVFGVNFPGLFMLIYKGENSFYINVFNKGLIFTKDDVITYIENLDLDENEAYYLPCSNLDMVQRIIRTLILDFEKNEEYQKADELKEVLLFMDRKTNLL